MDVFYKIRLNGELFNWSRVSTSLGDMPTLAVSQDHAIPFKQPYGINSERIEGYLVHSLLKILT